MTRIIRIKNNSGTSGTWLGQTIADGVYYDIQTAELLTWQSDTSVFDDIGNGNLIINNGADTTDDITNAVTGWNWLNAEDHMTDPSTLKHVMQQSSKPRIPGKNFQTCWTGAGDDMTTPALGEGSLLIIKTVAGTAKSSVDISFHPDFGDVYIHEGYLQWENAGWGDYITVSGVATATPLQTSTNLDYTITSNKIKAVAAGTGTHGLDGTPVFVPNTTGTGWWDLVSGSAQFSSGQTGAFDWYDIEITVMNFMKKIPVYGSSLSYVVLHSSDTHRLPPGYVLRVTADNVSNTVWRAWMFMTLYREQTV